VLSEKTLTRKCNKLFKRLQIEHDGFFFQKLSDRFTSGISDYYVIYNGTSVWIELKAVGKKPDKIQVYFLQSLKRAGAITMWTDDFQDVVELMDSVLG